MSPEIHCFILGLVFGAAFLWVFFEPQRAQGERRRPFFLGPASKEELPRWTGHDPATAAELAAVDRFHKEIGLSGPVSAAILGDLFNCATRREHDGGPCPECLPDPERDACGHLRAEAVENPLNS